ncbi:hypothetical protein AVEN_187646-1 [Araneus ventricosus]|uniref:MADF domain-containing protein n=1 Tax=Araneus ventricosus TaxID=182803 RepID=A0A4Y2BCI0_ARAVE|nr:hypothetical protein AVEN_7236-1 [Araneus ventricosus]GBL89674.1 hypothetical protein AVEN_267380-1 [Araneus ventricosus]GBL89723.1 hypothetical protein AVEN_43089-1 [Araneus ventricosus]GBL89731.1 hypothetical protein AVEN_48767-1 [Araneus ventricosus]GBL89755.1 hypothetical protein AVEN_81457-1 [Araneus ventricosus]
MVKRKINALRTNYRKELRKVEKSKEMNRRTGEPVYVPSLWYFELFHFIADQESEPPIIDVTGDGVDVQGMLGVDFDENYERDEMSDEFDEEVSGKFYLFAVVFLPVLRTVTFAYKPFTSNQSSVGHPQEVFSQ